MSFNKIIVYRNLHELSKKAGRLVKRVRHNAGMHTMAGTLTMKFRQQTQLCSTKATSLMQQLPLGSHD